MKRQNSDEPALVNRSFPYIKYNSVFVFKQVFFANIFCIIALCKKTYIYSVICMSIYSYIIRKFIF